MVNAGPAGPVTRRVTVVLLTSVFTLTTAYGRSVLTKLVVSPTGVTSPPPNRPLDLMPSAMITPTN